MMEFQKGKYFGVEKRKFPRIRASVVEYCPIGNVESKQLSFTEDLGAGGMRIFCSQDFKIDTLLLLKIYLPLEKEPIEAKARVIWSRQSHFLDKNTEEKNYDVGVEFIEIDEEDRQSIFEYTQNHY